MLPTKVRIILEVWRYSRTTILVPYSYHWLKSLQLIWRWDTLKYHLWMLNIQMRCKDLTVVSDIKGYQDCSPSNCCPVARPILRHYGTLWQAKLKRRLQNSSTSPGVGVTKAPFVNFSISKIFDPAKVPVILFASHSYLIGVTAAELRQHLSNMNMIFQR